MLAIGQWGICAQGLAYAVAHPCAYGCGGHAFPAEFALQAGGHRYALGQGVAYGGPHDGLDIAPPVKSTPPKPPLTPPLMAPRATPFQLKPSWIPTRLPAN